jgi:hypothetical protein
MHFKVEQEWATIFVRGPHCSFICGSRAKFQSKKQIQSEKISLRGPDVTRGPYVAPSWSRDYAISSDGKIGAIYLINNTYFYIKYFLKNFAFLAISLWRFEPQVMWTPVRYFTFVSKVTFRLRIPPCANTYLKIYTMTIAKKILPKPYILS